MLTFGYGWNSYFPLETEDIEKDSTMTGHSILTVSSSTASNGSLLSRAVLPTFIFHFN